MIARLPDRFSRRQSWGMLAAGLLLLLLFRLGSRGLNEPDEGRYANIALGMVQTGDWWEPRLSGYGHYDKPPMIYWATAASFKMLGLNEWAARMPPLFGAICALIGLGWTAFRLYGERRAWWAVLIGGTLVQFWTCARLLTPDMLLTGWCTLAIAAWAECRHRGGAWGWWLLSLLGWTLAWWTKATPALVPLAGLALGVWLGGDPAGRRALRPWLLLPAILIAGAPWYLSMMHQHPELREFFLGRELAGRLTGNVHRRGGSVLYYLPISAVGWLPWWPLAVWAMWKHHRQSLSRNGLARRLGPDGWIVLTGLVIFSLNSSKLPTYTLVLAPWAALLMARALAGVFDVAGDPERSHLPERLELPRPAVVALLFFVLVVLLASLLMPRAESGLGANSSLRQVCRTIQLNTPEPKNALVFFDRHWPGAEFYFAQQQEPLASAAVLGKIRGVFLGVPPIQRSTDAGPAQSTFADPAQWRTVAQRMAPGAVWTVRYRKARKSPFASPGSTAAKESVVGDFALDFFPTAAEVP